MHRLAPVVLVAVGGVLAAPVLAGCAEDTEMVKTVTVERPAAALSPSKEPSKRRRERSSEEAAPATSAAPTEFVHCDSNIEVKAETTTCDFAQNTFWHYWMSAESSALQVYSPAGRSMFDVSCTVGSGRVQCTTTDGGAVRFTQAAVGLYSQAQADAYAGSHDLGPDPYESLALSDARPSDPGSSHDYDYDDYEDEDVPQSLYNPRGNIPNYENGRGYRVQCNDGMYSRSGGIQGGCSGHGGVAP